VPRIVPLTRASRSRWANPQRHVARILSLLGMGEELNNARRRPGHTGRLVPPLGITRLHKHTTREGSTAVFGIGETEFVLILLFASWFSVPTSCRVSVVPSAVPAAVQRRAKRGDSPRVVQTRSRPRHRGDERCAQAAQPQARRRLRDDRRGHRCVHGSLERGPVKSETFAEAEEAPGCPRSGLGSWHGRRGDDARRTTQPPPRRDADADVRVCGCWEAPEPEL